ncbi:hypothetical protein C8F01DRAFT_1239345 [Mycena amicta]|nr:hypothetical protein C8F01DRAFT_1239345 [Mycena amicta]
MSDNALPDEVLSEILAPALKVDDETFSDTSDVSPFATYSESASAYLLVNKSWLRVATPLLYNTVVLRSKAQAKALERALSGNAILGQFIKQLRVEGGYGAPMHRILKLSPNIAHLYLTFMISSGDSTDGLCKGLALISPTRVILYDALEFPNHVKNKMVRNLVDAVVAAIPGWHKLSIFHCPYFFASNPRWESITRPLLEAQQVHTLTVNYLSDAVWAYAMFKSCPLRSIIVKAPLSRYDQEERVDKDTVDPALRALLKYKPWRSCNAVPDITAPELQPTLDPFYKPMSNASEEVQDRIWSRILHFAMYIPELGELPMRGNIPRTRVRLLTVSSRFKRLGISLLCVHVYLWRRVSVASFIRTLSKNAHLKRNIRTLAVNALPYTSLPSEARDYQAAMQQILSGITGLHRLSSLQYNDSDEQSGRVYVNDDAELAIGWDTFLAVDFGALEECSIRIETDRFASPAVFSRFVELRVLHWCCETSFNLMSTVVLIDALPKLEELIVRESDSSFATVLSRMKLPSLTRARFLQTMNNQVFLNVHGNKLSALEIPSSAFPTLTTHILDLCPNLISLTVGWSYDNFVRPSSGGRTSIMLPDSDAFNALNPATPLVEIFFRSVVPIEQSALKERWREFLINTFPHESLPNLKDIRTTAFTWPTTERDIAKSAWVVAAESLSSKNITLKDAEGKSWRPRLKVGKGAAGTAVAVAEASHSSGRSTRSSTRLGGRK